MSTIVWATFYLWLVLTILLAAMWYLRRQDLQRHEQPDGDTLDAGSNSDTETDSNTGSVADAKKAASQPASESEPEPEPAPAATSDAEPKSEAEPEPESESDPEVTEKAASETSASSPWKKKSPPKKKPQSKKKSSPDKRSQSKKAASKTAAESEPTVEAAPDSGTESKSAPDTQSKPKDNTTAAKKSGPKKKHAVPANGDEPGAIDNAPVAAENEDASSDAPLPRTDGPDLEQLLDGIELPYDLTPVELSIVEPVTHAVFLSSHADAGEVGTAFADQLVELGYDIEAAGFDQAVAKRNGDVLSMRIEAGAGKSSDTARYPNAGTDDVAIEIWAGDGPPPTIEG